MLKPCPFCGGGAQEKSYEIDRFTDGKEIKCKCGVELCVSFGQDLRSSWNTRPLEDALQARCDAMAEALGFYANREDWKIIEIEVDGEDESYWGFIPVDGCGVARCALAKAGYAYPDKKEQSPNATP